MMTVTARHRQASPKHYIYRHKKAGFPCQIVKRYTAEEVFQTMSKDLMIRGFVLRICECGASQQGWGVVGKLKEDERCGSKCRSSKGPSCECSCSGVNHGSNY